MPPDILVRPFRDEYRTLERDLAALVLDRHLRRLARHESLCRLVLGRIAREILRRRAYEALGFARLGDYARERLGLSAREVHSVAQVCTSLEGLPAIASAFRNGELSWTQARLLAGVADAANESAWVEVARGRTVRALEALLRKSGRNPPAPTADGRGGSIGDRADAACGDGTAAADGEHTIDREPAVRFRLACPRVVRVLWRGAVELARRVAGEELSEWRVAEAIAAEALAGAPDHLAGAPDTRGAIAAPASHAGGPTGATDRTGVADPNEIRDSFASALDWSAIAAAIPPELNALDRDLQLADAADLDTRLRIVVRAMQQIDWQTGLLLRLLFDLRLYLLMGFPSGPRYVRERLGISTRKARALIAIERRATHSRPLADAYEAGQLSWLQTLTLLPVAGDAVAEEWARRAQRVTLRRLADEVAWALDEADFSNGESQIAPPDPETPLVREARQMRAHPGGATATEWPQTHAHCGGAAPSGSPEMHDRGQGEPNPEPCGISASAGGERDHGPWQMRAHDSAEPVGLKRLPVDAEIRFTAPASIVTLLESAIDRFAEPRAPRWQAFAAMLEWVAREWEGQAPHRDPIFSRDGWRCAVPVCSSRRNLQDHHVRFRSRGGGNQLANRISLCAWHHLRGVHAGVIRVEGEAPDGLRWEVGVGRGGAPLLRLRGAGYLS